LKIVLRRSGLGSPSGAVFFWVRNVIDQSVFSDHRGAAIPRQRRQAREARFGRNCRASFLQFGTGLSDNRLGDRRGSYPPLPWPRQSATKRSPVFQGRAFLYAMGAASFQPDVLFRLQRSLSDVAIFSSCGVAAHFTSVKSGDHRNPHTTSKMKRPQCSPGAVSFLGASGRGIAFALTGGYSPFRRSRFRTPSNFAPVSLGRGFFVVRGRPRAAPFLLSGRDWFHGRLSPKAGAPCLRPAWVSFCTRASICERERWTNQCA
jgi:hypothetical protein